MRQDFSHPGSRGNWRGVFRCAPVCVMLSIALASCGHDAPEERLRAAVGQLQLAIEERSSGSIEDSLAEDFIGPEGLDRKGARRMALGVFLRHRDVGVTLGPLRVDMKQDHATVEFTAVLTGGSGGLLPQSGRIYDVRTGWRMEGDEWRLTSAQWTAGPR